MLTRQLGIEVSFVGARPHEEVPQWMAACDVCTLPSWNEGTPNVVLEALACGRRIVATRVGGTPAIVTSETLGILVPPKDPLALATALEKALSLDRPFDAEAVSAALDAPDWRDSAQRLHASLVAARSAPIPREFKGCSAQEDKKAYKKIGKIGKVEGTAARGAEGLLRCASMSAPNAGSDPS
jgi:glycosyltransferase involved in cell wall biosynthesis